MVISILTCSLKSGGAQKQSALLAKVLSFKYKIVYVVIDGTNANKSFLEILNEGKDIEIVYLNGNKITDLFKLIKVYKKHRPTFSFSYLPFGNFINGVASKITGIKKSIGGIRNSEVEKSKFFVEKISHNLFLNCSISNSKAGVIWHKAGGFKKNIYFIPNCYPLLVNLINREKQKKTIQIISVGRFVEQKNYGLALDSIKLCVNKLKDTEYNIKYTIVGYGELEIQIREMIKQMGIENFVEIVINPSNINDYYIASDIYLCTSKFEGMSNSIMEAMSYSLPIVATNVGGNPELVYNNENGNLTTENAVDISSSLLSFILSSDLRNKSGKRSFELLKNNFSEKAFFKEYELILKNL
jgi:glycosyltransferase involved in cell wall biosynthesis